MLLARGVSAAKVGERVGKSERTIRRWREDPAFEESIKAARRAGLHEAVAALEATCRAAVSVLGKALGDENPAIRVRAALGLLNALPVLSGHAGLEERVAALEAGLVPESGR